MKPP
jgi:hypothetical protein